MSLHPDDPRLTAYLMGELSADESVAVEQEVAADPSLQRALRDLTTLRQVLTETLALVPNSLRPDQREAIRQAARQPLQSELPLTWEPRRTAKKSRLIPLSAAAVILLSAAIFIPNSSVWKPTIATQQPAAATHQPTQPELPARPLPAPGPATPEGVNPAPATGLAATPTDFPVLRTRQAVLAADCPTLALPVQAGDTSLAWIRDSIRNEHQLPPRNSVRLEEILNRFSLHPNGLTVVARDPAKIWHPDDRSTGETAHAATLAVETMTCPWQPSATLVIVSIRGNPFSDCEIQAAFHANPAMVRSYRLLGFAPAIGQPQTPLPTHLPAKSSTSLVIEIETSTAVAPDLGVIAWSVNGKPAAPLTLTRRNDDEPSDDARFAALVCTFAQWLTDQPAGMITNDLLDAFTRENTSATLPPERADFIQLIHQALEL